MKYILSILLVIFLLTKITAQEGSKGRKMRMRGFTILDKQTKIKSSALPLNNKKQKKEPLGKPLIYAKAKVISDTDGILYLSGQPYNIKKGNLLSVDLQRKFDYYFVSKDTTFISNTNVRTLSEVEKDQIIELELKIALDLEQQKYVDKEQIISNAVFKTIQENMVSVDGLYDKIKNYQLSKFEVTVEQFRQFIKETDPYKFTTATRSSSGVINDSYDGNRTVRTNIDWRHNPRGKIHTKEEYAHPVKNISYEEAIAFCAWLSNKDKNYTYRLPSKFEWQYVAGCGDLSSIYPWGNSENLEGRYANIADQTLAREIKILGKENYESTYNDGYDLTSPVGTFNPTCDSYYDLAGNVSEWCMDEITEQNKTKRAYMGGSYFKKKGKSKLGNNAYLDETLRHAAIGFRVCREFKISEVDNK